MDAGISYTLKVGVTSEKYRNGNYRVTGVVTANGAPVRRKVSLFVYPEFTYIASTWSREVDGVYSFDWVHEKPNMGSMWAVMAVDHTGVFDPEVKLGFDLFPMEKVLLWQ